MQIQMRTPCFRWPLIQDVLDAARALCALGPQVLLLKGRHVTRGTMQVSDVEAAADATTASGDLRVDRVERDGLVQRGANQGNFIPGGTIVGGTHDGLRCG